MTYSPLPAPLPRLQRSINHRVGNQPRGRRPDPNADTPIGRFEIDRYVSNAALPRLLADAGAAKLQPLEVGPEREQHAGRIGEVGMIPGELAALVPAIDPADVADLGAGVGEGHRSRVCEPLHSAARVVNVGFVAPQFTRRGFDSSVGQSEGRTMIRRADGGHVLGVAVVGFLAAVDIEDRHAAQYRLDGRMRQVGFVQHRKTPTGARGRFARPWAVAPAPFSGASQGPDQVWAPSLVVVNEIWRGNRPGGCGKRKSSGRPQIGHWAFTLIHSYAVRGACEMEHRVPSGCPMLFSEGNCFHESQAGNEVTDFPVPVADRDFPFPWHLLVPMRAPVSKGRNKRTCEAVFEDSECRRCSPSRKPDNSRGL